MKFTIHSLLYIAIALLTIRCGEESDPNLDAQKFLRIYDNSNFNATYYPIDMVQTADEGFIVLSGKKLYKVNPGEGNADPIEEESFVGVYLLKLDRYGNVISELDVADSLVHPVGKLMVFNNQYHFFCMNKNTNVRFAHIDENLENFAAQQIGLTYPLAASFINNQFLVLSYNHDNKQNIVTVLSPDGNVIDSKGYGIGIGDDEVEEPIVKHFHFNGRHYPFEVGQLSNSMYFYNGFYNNTLALVLTNLGDGEEPNGVVNGYQRSGGLSAIMPLGGYNFATAWFNYGDNYFSPKVTYGLADFVNDHQSFTFPELVPDAKVKILRTTIDAKNVLVYATDTRAKQIGLYFYDEASGAFMSSRYLGFSNPFEIASIISTTDGGIAVSGTTYLSGRFPRVCLFKISKDELAKQVK